MNDGLFSKYSAILSRRKNEVDEIIDFIEKETGAIFSYDEIIIKKKNISFQTSSVKKIVLYKKIIRDFLQLKGYIVSL